MLFFVLVFAFNMQSYGIRLFTRLVQMRRLWWQWLTSRLTGRCTRSWMMSPRRSATCLMESFSSPGLSKWEDCDGKYRINRMTFNRVILSLVQNMYIHHMTQETKPELSGSFQLPRVIFLWGRAGYPAYSLGLWALVMVWVICKSGVIKKVAFFIQTNL